MKYFYGFLLLFIFQQSYSQPKNYKITVEEKALDQVLIFMESEYGLRFSYDPLLCEKTKVSINIKSKSKQDFLGLFFEAIPLKSKKVRNVYIILPDKKPLEKKLYGKVLDADDGSPLAFAMVSVNEKLGVIADQNGFFQVVVPRDSARVAISYLGYKDKFVTVSTNQNNLSVDLFSDANQLPEFILDANNGKAKLAGFSSINPNQISTLPSLGETDIFKSLQILPGITATDESASGLIIRGGSPDQNLVLLDGFTIYHLDHFFGIFSTFNPNTINHVDIYKGGFNARYGGRVSAVVDAKGKSWGADKIQGGININSTSTSGYFQTPIGTKSFLNLGLRGSHYNLVKSNLYKEFLDKNRVDILNIDNPDFANVKLDLEPDFSFYDFNAKWIFVPNNKNTWDFNLYLSDDDYEGIGTEDFGISLFDITDKAVWSNSGISINWAKDWNRKISSELTLSVSGYEGASGLRTTEKFKERVDLRFVDFDVLDDSTIIYQDFNKSNYINDFTFKWHHTLAIDTFNTLSFGTELKNIGTGFAISYFDVIDTDIFSNGVVNSLYASNNFSRNKLTIDAGLRYSYLVSPNKHYFEPRLSSSYKITDALTINGVYSLHNQFVNRISISPFGNSDQFYWVLADEENYPVMNSEHLILGLSYKYKNWTFEAEGYSKHTSGILESELALSSSFNGVEIDDFRDLVVPNGVNNTKGIDFFVKRTSDKYISWLGYTLSSSRNMFSELNMGLKYPSSYDQTHEVNWVNTLKLKKWEFSSVFIYGSGRPYTSKGEVSQEKIILFDFNNINAFRLPSYHRLDLSAKFNTSFKRLKFSTGVTLFNTYNRKNLKSRRFSIRYNFDEAGKITSLTAFPVEIRLLGFTPNFFLNIGF